VEVLGISVWDKRNKLEGYIQRFREKGIDMAYPILIGSPKKHCDSCVRQKYGVSKVPVTFVIDKKGIIFFRHNRRVDFTGGPFSRVLEKALRQ